MRLRVLGLSGLFLLAFIAGMGGLLDGCGGSSGSKMMAPTPRCVRASDCKAPLICVQGYCVTQCKESRDCPAGERCTITTDGNSCQPPEKRTCLYTSECTMPLVCAVDMQCRNQCEADVDCPKNQKCTDKSKLCADPTQDKNYDPVANEFKNLGPDGGAGTTGGGGSTGSGGSTDGGGGGTTGAGGSGGTAQTDGGGADVAPSLDGPPLMVDGVVVMPNASVRQGAINITITITKTKGGLSNPTSFDLGGLTVRVQDGTDTTLNLKVSVPHGAALGKRTLKFAASGGVVTAADVVEVTAITVGPTGMDANAGSAGAPFLTLKQAITVADSGDTIHLLDGTYDVKSGETWGYVVPNNLTIVGDSTAMTILNGAGATTTVNGFNASTALTLKSLTVEHFYYGIDIKSPSTVLTFQDVALVGNGSYGIYVEQTAMGSTLNISGKNGLIDQPGQVGIEVYYAPMVTVNITDGTIQGGSNLISFAGSSSGSKLNITGTTIKQLATYDAINVSVSSNAVGTVATIAKANITGTVTFNDAKGSLTITGSTITQKSGDGIDFSNGALLSMADTTVTLTALNTAINYSAAQGTMSLKNVQIMGGGYGIQQNGLGSSAKLRGTSIMGTTYYGYYLTAGDLDLGTATEAGDNRFGNPLSTGYYCLYIGRAQGMAAGNPVTCSSTAFGATGPLDGNVPPPGTVDASAGTVTVPPQRYQLTTGNKLIFY